MLAGPEAGRLTHAEMEDQLTVLSRELVRALHQDELHHLRAARERRRVPVTGSDQVRRGSWSRVMTGRPGDGVRAGHGEPDGLPAPGRREPVSGGRGAEPAGGQVLLRPGPARGDRGAARVVRAGRRGGHPRHRGPDRQAPGRGAHDRGRGRRGRLLCRAPGRARRRRRAAGDAIRRQWHCDAAGGAAGGDREGRGGQPAASSPPGCPRGRRTAASAWPSSAASTTARRCPRTAADIITRPGNGPRSPGPQAAPAAAGKWLTASVTDDIPAVIAAGFAEADRRDPARQRTWIALVDGNKQQIEAIEAEAARHGVEVTILIDFIHVLEYLLESRLEFLRTRRPRRRDLGRRPGHQDPGRQSRPGRRGIRRRATTYGYTGKERDGADTCANYLTAKKPYLDYATALASGWPIATGIIEGACRHIVKDRMDITGARWGLDGAEAILKLRALDSNGDFDAYWTWHLEQEQQRIHYARYQDPSTLAA